MDINVVLILLAGIVAMDTTSGPQILISEPVVSCFILGILFGMPQTGLIMGLLFQLLWLGYMPLGAARLVDGNMAAFIATAGLFKASRIFYLEGDVLNAAIVPAMFFGVFAGYVGLHLTNGVRRLNSRRSDHMRLLFEKGEMISLGRFHLLGVSSSFSRGILMALVLIPVGTLICGSVAFLPSKLINGLAISRLLIWGPVTAPALLFFWLKGRQRFFILGSIGGILWILLLALQKG